MGEALNGEERRRAARQRVQRRALYAEGGDYPQIGVVADVSASGLRIETDAPVRAGTELDIEVHPSSGEWTGGLRVRGRVVHVAEEADGGAAMGIRVLKASAPSPRPALPAVRPRLRPHEWPGWAPTRTTPGSPWARAVPVAALSLLILGLFVVGRWTPAPTAPRPAIQEAVASAVEEASPIRLVVDKSDRRLTLMLNDRPLRTFNVELPRPESAPDGDFRVADKAERPVRKPPSRSPSRKGSIQPWMTFAGADLKPAVDVHVAGTARTPAGIAVRPEDAATLLRFCPVGTPVRIQP